MDRRTTLTGELAAIKTLIQLDDERLRRALIPTNDGELQCERGHVVRAGAGLREEVSQLNHLRIVHAEQVRELAASIALLKELSIRRGSGEGDSTRLMPTLHELTRLSESRLQGLQEEKQVLRGELQRLRDDCQAVSRETELERTRQNTAREHCHRLQVTLEHSAGGIETQQLHGLLTEAVQELKAEAGWTQSDSGDLSRSNSERRANQRSRPTRVSRSYTRHRGSTGALF
eukprot:COSAG02_NODE_20_length_53673_cov_86.864841_7_plen_231_part_00